MEILIFLTLLIMYSIAVTLYLVERLRIERQFTFHHLYSALHRIPFHLLSGFNVLSAIARISGKCPYAFLSYCTAMPCPVADTG